MEKIYNEILSLINNETNFAILRKKLDKYHPYDLAEAFKELNNEDKSKFYILFTDEELADIFEYLDAEESSLLLEDVEDKKAASIINEMETDDAADVLNEMEKDKASSIIKLLDEETRSDLQDLSKYDEDTAGSIMTSNFLKVNIGQDVKEAMRIVVKKAPDMESINTIFIVNDEDELKGVLGLKKLIITKSPCLIDDIMNINFQYVNTMDSLEEVSKKISDYDIYEMPVLENGIIRGMITMDDAADALVDVQEEDYAKLAGLTEDQDEDEKVVISVRKRIPWLAILLVLDIIVAIIISQFDYIIEKATILVLFQPVILGLAGNCGTQSLAVAVRKIANDELVTKKSIFKHLGKEISLGCLTGLILGIISFGLTILILYIWKNNEIEILRVGLVVGVSISISLITSNFIGSILPIIFYKIKIDPAVASGPFITTLNDIISVVIYFTIASIIIYNML